MTCPPIPPSRIALGAALLALHWGVQAATPPQTIALTAEQETALHLEVAAPTPAERAVSRRFPAQVVVPVRQTQVVSAPQDGTLSAVLAAVGESVAAGQSLARMQSPGLLEAQGSLLEAQTRLSLAESELGRDRALLAEGLIPRRRLQSTQAEHDALATQVDQLGQRLALAGMSPEAIAALKRDRRLSGTLDLSSPIDGVVLERMVDPGQAVAAAAPLFRIASLSPLWLEVHVPVDRIGGTQAGERVVLPREGIEGRVLTVGRQVHGTDQGVLVRAEVRQGAERLHPGQFVEVQLDAGTAGAGWRLPAAALVRGPAGTFVFARVPGGFAPVPVEVLAQEEQGVVVSGALAATDRVAMAGVATLKAIWLKGD